jgi:hypothetical protein
VVGPTRVVQGEAGLPVCAAPSEKTTITSPRLAGVSERVGAVLVAFPTLVASRIGPTRGIPENSRTVHPAVAVAPTKVIVTVCDPEVALSPYQMSMTPMVPGSVWPKYHVALAPETDEAAYPEVAVVLMTHATRVSPVFVTVTACAIEPAVTATLVVGGTA